MPDESSSTLWLARLKPKTRAILRLFCFPHAGGNASIYRPWANKLPPWVELCLIKLPGRENRFAEPPFARLSPLLEALTPLLVPYLDMPFALFGHSMGALVSFELARYLRRYDVYHHLVHLFVSGYRAPQLPNPNPPIHQLPQTQFIEELRLLHGTPEEVLEHAELTQLLLPALRADFALHETYLYVNEKPLDCSISAFGGLEDNEVHPQELSAWQTQTSRSFTLHMFPGDHFFLHNSPAAFLEVLSQELAKVVARAM